MGKTVIKMILKLIQLIIGDVITAIISISIILCSVDCSESNSRLSYIVSRWNFFPLFLYLVEKITDRFTTLLPKTTISQLELGLLVNKWDLFVLRHPHSQSMNCKFRCVKRIEVLLLSLDRMIVHRRLPHSTPPPPAFCFPDGSRVLIHTLGRVVRGTVRGRLSCPRTHTMKWLRLDSEPADQKSGVAN